MVELQKKGIDELINLSDEIKLGIGSTSLKRKVTQRIKKKESISSNQESHKNGGSIAFGQVLIANDDKNDFVFDMNNRKLGVMKGNRFTFNEDIMAGLSQDVIISAIQYGFSHYFREQLSA